MGYRNYFAIIEKDKADNILNASKEEQIRFIVDGIRNEYKSNPQYAEDEVAEYLETGEVDYWRMKNYIGLQEIHECGKYFDYETSDEIKEDCKDYSDDDTEFCIIQPKALLICAEHYKQNAAKWWRNLIRSLDMTDEEIKEDWKNYPGGKRPDIKQKLEWHVRDLEDKGINILNTDLNDKYSLTTSWLYEYTMFELIHLYKSIDWNKYYLVWLGY
jgi:hypothetical protein